MLSEREFSARRACLVIADPSLCWVIRYQLHHTGCAGSMENLRRTFASYSPVFAIDRVANLPTPPNRTPLNFRVPHPFGFRRGAGLDSPPSPTTRNYQESLQVHRTKPVPPPSKWPPRFRTYPSSRTAVFLPRIC